MTVQTPPLVLQNSSHTADRHRQWMRYVHGNRGGVVQGGLAVTQNGTPNMSVNVGDGMVLVPGTENSVQGTYVVENIGALNVPLSAADPTNPRRDLIIARVRDAIYSGASNTATLEVVAGTPAASPADPSLPTGSCWVIARVAVGAAVSSIVNANITRFAEGGTGYTGQNGSAAALGGVIACTSSTRPLNGLFAGMQAYETDTGRVITYNGSAWIVQPYIVSSVDTGAAQIGNAGYSDPTVAGSPGPSVSLLTGSKVLVTVGMNATTDAANGQASIGIAVTGASSVAATDLLRVLYQSYASGSFAQVCNTFQISGLTPGVNTFTCKYKGLGVVTVATMQYRHLAVQCAI